jgi:hypothetical protein
VQAFALPALTITALARPAATIALDTITGAAQNAFVVKMPATTAGRSDARIARSSLSGPGVLIPA